MTNKSGRHPEVRAKRASKDAAVALRGPLSRPPQGDGMLLLLKSVDEPAQQPRPDFVLADGVLDAVFEARIVVDFHDHDTVRSLFEVDAIESVADRPRRAHGDVDHFPGRLVEPKGAEAAFMRGAIRPVLDHLPMPARHAVLADKERLAGEYADPPIEIGREEF